MLSFVRYKKRKRFLLIFQKQTVLQYELKPIGSKRDRFGAVLYHNPYTFPNEGVENDIINQLEKLHNKKIVIYRCVMIKSAKIN